MSEKGAYEKHLQHIAEPQAPSERDKAPSTTLPDWVALWFTEQLRDYAHYDADEPQSGIAVGLASYIDSKVRDQGRSHVTVYAHTEAAVDAVEEAAEYADKGREPLFHVGSAAGELRLAHIDFEHDGAEVVEIDGEVTVVYDEAEARESLAEMKMAEAESERLAELEAMAEKRGINNRETPRVNPRWGE